MIRTVFLAIIVIFGISTTILNVTTTATVYNDLKVYESLRSDFNKLESKLNLKISDVSNSFDNYRIRAVYKNNDLATRFYLLEKYLKIEYQEKPEPEDDTVYPRYVPTKTEVIQKGDRVSYSFSKIDSEGTVIPHTKIACFATNEWTEESKNIQCYLIKSDKSKHLLVLQDDPTKSEFDMMKE